MEVVSSDIFVMVALGVLGTLLGSFANVVIVRLPLGESIIRPRSCCRSCQSLVRWFDNIPVFSWFILRGKCRNCSESISWKYPIVELLMGILFVYIFYRLGWQWFTLEILIFTFCAVTASFIDFDHYILPDILTLSGIVICLVGALINPERHFLDALLGFLMGGGSLWFVAYIYYTWKKVEAMGGGDIKLLAWIGALLGWRGVPFVILVASLLGAVVGIIVSTQTKGGLQTKIPFGPYLVLGALFYTFWGDQLMDWYWGIFLLSSH